MKGCGKRMSLMERENRALRISLNIREISIMESSKDKLFIKNTMTFSIREGSFIINSKDKEK